MRMCVPCRGDGPHRQRCREVYTSLRRNVLDNVVQQYGRNESAYIWENYSDSDGRGQGTHPFGWSALAALIALEAY
jgi:mannosyl-oligosaccharide glucosidase